MSERAASHLEQEIPEWVREGIISPEQGRLILARQPAQAAKRRQDLTVRLVSWIGATLVAVGIIVLVATNWRNIPELGRIALLVLTTAALWACGAILVSRNKTPVFGHVLLFLGAGAFGGLVFQVANTYHLSPDNAGLVAVWGVGILPVAYGLRSRGVHAMALLLFPLWIGLTLGEGGLHDARSVVMSLIASGLLLWGIGLLHPRWGQAGKLPDFQETYLAVGALLVHIPAFVFTFFGRWGRDTPLLAGASPAAATWAVLVWLLAAAALAAGLAWTFRKSADRWMGALVAAGAAQFLMVLLVPAGVADDITYGILLVASIVLAIQARSELLFNLGLVLFVAMVVGRYFEFVFDEGNPGWIFVVGGAILIAISLMLERLRRAVAPRLRGGPA